MDVCFEESVVESRIFVVEVPRKISVDAESLYHFHWQIFLI